MQTTCASEQLGVLWQQTFASELMVCLRTGAGSDPASASYQRMEQLVEGHVRSRSTCSSSMAVFT
jgi:hypothetical protein